MQAAFVTTPHRIRNHQRTALRASRGFSLLEMVISLAVLGIVSVIVFPTLQMIGSITNRAAAETQRQMSEKMKTAMLSFAKNATALGRLPAPWTHSASGTKSAPVDMTNTNLVNEMLLAGLDRNSLNDDGTAAQNVRIYQRVTGLTYSMPLYFQAGPTVTLTYEYGVIYSTMCSRRDTTGCHAATLPGGSAALTSGNYQTWSVAGTDYWPTFVSSLPLQKDMLRETMRRVDRVREALIANFNARVLLATPSDTTNWHPSASTSMAGYAPASNAGCRDGWYSLASTNILDGLGLTATEFGSTAWGGVIEYCRDYDPTGTSGVNNPPHFAALRLNRDVSSGTAPDAVTSSNNVVFAI